MDALDVTWVPRVSIVLPTYNGDRYLRRAIDSCLQQSFADCEVIVVIDGSTDDTRDIVASYEDRRLRSIQKENGGLPVVLNTGFDVAREE